MIYFGIHEDQSSQKQHSGASQKKDNPARSPLLRIHGNILYDLNYQSRIDTPYAEKEVYQHTVQTYLDITYKDNYPFRIFLTTRFSNSSFFRNFTDLNLLYNANDFNNRVRRQVQSLLPGSFGRDSLDRIRNSIQVKEKDVYTLQNWVNASAQIQRLVARREDEWLRKTAGPDKPQNNKDTLQWPDLDGFRNDKAGQYKFPHHLPSSDSLKERKADSAGFEARYDSTKRRIDTLMAEISLLKEQYKELSALQNKNTGDLKKEIDQISSGTELKNKLKALHVSDSALPKGYQTLYSVRSFGIGRTLLDYSDLSAKNVSITGVQIEYNPSSYMVFAAGTVDYRFRDYSFQNTRKGQYIGLVRYGWGKKEGNNIILTYYTGRRQLYNSLTTAQGADIPNYNLMGFTLEGHYKINRTSTLVAEVAKSSSPYYSLDSSRPHNVLGSALKMGDHSNEAYSLKFSSVLPRTQTRLDASYRRFGANFQSFSLFTSGTEQSAWSVKVEQPFFKRHLLVVGSVRTNDFTNPFLNTGYKSSTVFKSIQATLRTKHLPTISVGYFPSAQITKISDSQFQENLFYTFTASVSHVYKVHDISMVSMLLYTQFYNKIADTNFVYFNTKNLLFSQNAFIGKLTWQLQLSVASNTAYNLYVAENKVDYKVTRWLSLGAGVKYNQQTVYNIVQWGYSGNAGIQVPRIGEFRIMADKGFIPGNNRQLVENKVGRLTYLKVF